MGESNKRIAIDGVAALSAIAFADLAGWTDDDHAAAFTTFRRGATALDDHPPKTRGLGTDAGRLLEILKLAAAMPLTVSRDEARAFFEQHFHPFVVTPVTGSGFFTGYYEPEVEGSLVPTARFATPLLKQPADLVDVASGEAAPGLDRSFRFARRTDKGLVEHPDRAAIMAGALKGRWLELVYLADPVDAFFIHIQGAARIALTDGRTMRVTYAAKSGHPYTPIGRVLLERGELERGRVTMAAIRAWLAAHPADANAVMAANRSYIFFREAPVADASDGPVAAAKVPLTAARSLAVDRLLHTFHTPVWVETALPSGEPFHHLLIAQDTGSAIVGAARGDIFFGSGAAAGDIAGGMSAGGRFVALLPRNESP